MSLIIAVSRARMLEPFLPSAPPHSHASSRPLLPARSHPQADRQQQEEYLAELGIPADVVRAAQPHHQQEEEELVPTLPEMGAFLKASAAGLWHPMTPRVVYFLLADRPLPNAFHYNGFLQTKSVPGCSRGCQATMAQTRSSASKPSGCRSSPSTPNCARLCLTCAFAPWRRGRRLPWLPSQRSRRCWPQPTTS
mgnify:CR=1 FL=1